MGQNKTVAEFFAGVGLMRLGLEKNGWNVVYANDIDPDKQEIYNANFHDGHFVLQDINTVSSASIPTVTLATASFPCTDLSLAGSRAGLMTGAQSSTFWAFTRILDEMAQEGRIPPLVLLENVTGFLTSKGGSDFRAALLEMNRLGYAVDAFVLNASWFVPQSRQRLFVTCVQRDLLEKGAGGSGLPMISQIRPAALVSFMLSNQDIAWNIRIVPPPGEKHTKLSDILEDLQSDHPDWWSPERAAYLYNQMSEKHKGIANDMVMGDAYTYGTAFRRMRNGKSMAELRTDGIAGCLRTPKGGSGRQILVRGGKGRFDARLLSARECARLMGVDDSYRLNVPLNQALFAFGDAVCVNAVNWIAENYLGSVMESGPASD